MTIQIGKNLLNNESETYIIITYKDIKKLKTSISTYNKLILNFTLENGETQWHEINPYKDELLIY